MVNNTYKFLLSDLKNIKGVGIKTSNILRKKKLILFSIYYGDCRNHTQIGASRPKLRILK